MVIKFACEIVVKTAKKITDFFKNKESKDLSDESN